MTEAAGTRTARNQWLTAAAWQLFRDRPIIPLLGLLVILVIVFGIVSPRSISESAGGDAPRRSPSRSLPAARRSRC